MKTIYFLVRAFDGASSIIQSNDYPKGFQSTTPGCESLEESKNKWGMPEAPCVECGCVFGTNYCEPYKSIMIRDNVCFGCNHWREMMQHNGSTRQAIINGSHYLVCAENSNPSRWNGHGGRKFSIRFNDGREITTTNLWSQGDIPKHFKDRLKDNAKFAHQLTPSERLHGATLAEEKGA